MREIITIQIPMNSKLKDKAVALLKELRMDVYTAFNIFVRQTLREGKIPFDIK